MDRLGRSLTQNSLGFVLRTHLVMYFLGANFFLHETDFWKNSASMRILGVELKLRKYCVLDLKMRQKVSLFGAFLGRVDGRARSPQGPAPKMIVDRRMVLLYCVFEQR